MLKEIINFFESVLFGVYELAPVYVTINND